MMCATVRGLTPMLLILSAFGLGCGDATGPEQRSADDLRFLRLAAGAPPLAATEVSFWAVRGQDREASLNFQATGGGPGNEFVKLRVPSGALLARPDGSPILAGDSVLITLRAVDPARIMFEFEPAGLQFNPADPADLRIEYDEADSDFDSDGDVDPNDAALESSFAIWRQAVAGAPFVRLGTALMEDLNQVDAELTGFSRYSIAY